MNQAQILIENWHVLMPLKQAERSVVKKGAESDEAFTRRVLGKLASCKDIIIINDEAHHAYRKPADVKISSGGTFECKGEDWQGTAFVAKVTQKDSGGSIEWKLDGMIYDPVKGMAAVKEKVGKEIDCGSKAFVAVKGTKMECKSEGKTATVTFKDDEGSFDDGFEKLF